jgi:hypothetical protein
MRNSLRFVNALAATLAVGAWAIPAAADVDVYATLYKDKDVTVTVDVTIDKNIDVTVEQDAVLDGTAQADANINQVNRHNTVNDAVAGESQDFQLELDALIGGESGSVNNNTGIVGVNQDVGNMVNQANSVAFALTDSETSFTDAEAWAEQINSDNYSRQEEVLDPQGCDAAGECDADRTATIQDSVNENSGVVGVNQNAGNNNNQANGVAMAVGEGSHAALAEAALGQVNTLNQIVSIETVKRPGLNSVNGNSGIVGVDRRLEQQQPGLRDVLQRADVHGPIEVPGSI